MWQYEKKLQFPVKIKNPNPKYAQIITTQYGGPEQKARTNYDNLLRLFDDPDIREPLKFLRQREIIHYQRFGEGLRLATDRMNCKNFYACNPSFDKNCFNNK